MKRFSLLCAVICFSVLLVGGQAKAATPTFTDVPASHWASQDIEFLVQEQLLGGYPDGTFGVKKTITRAEVAVFLTRSLALKTGASTFKDVPAKHWARESIGKVAAANLMGGYPDGTFRPSAALSREELSVVLVRAYALAGKPSQTVVPPVFKDVKEDSWSGPSIHHLARLTLLSGYPDGTFRPKQAVTRPEFASFLTRTLRLETPETNGELMVEFLDVGQGDSTLIRTPSGKFILIDAGTSSSGAKVVQHLKDRHVKKLDMVVATHPHADHIGGLQSVLNAFPVIRFVDSGRVHTSLTYKNLLTSIDTKNIPFEIGKIGKNYVFDQGFTMATIHADSKAKELNDASVSFRATYGDVSFLLTGDAEKGAEQSMIDSGNLLKSTIYKAGHHGSNTSSTPAFLQKVQPEATIFSYGKTNTYGHPHPSVVQRLQALGSALYSTAESGDIMVKTDGKRYTISPAPWDPAK